MGTYFGVSKVENIGYRIIPVAGEQPVASPDAFLVAVVCNGVWAIAPEVTDKCEYEAFYNSYSQGNWLSFKVYAIRNEDRDKCPDEGRVPCW